MRLSQHLLLLAGPHPRSLSLGGGLRPLPSGASLGPRAPSLLAGPHPRSLSLGGGLRPLPSGASLGRLVLAGVCLMIATGCRQDMHNQPKSRGLRPSMFFADGSSARPLVEGTVARGTLKEDEAFFTGKVANVDVKELPFAVDEAVLNRGQERFNIFCTPCHDRTGSGQGMVVKRGYRPPPSFHIDRLRAADAGHFFDVMTNGFGAMPDYKVQISARDRWAIVAYVRALQLSQHATQADIPGGDPTKLTPPGGGEPAPEGGVEHQ